MPIEVHVADVGTVFEATITDQDAAVVDISAASTKESKFRKPTGAVLTKTATLVNTGTDGKMKYTSLAGDLDVAGVWQVQGHVVIGGGNWHTDLYRFTVHPTL